MGFDALVVVSFGGPEGPEEVMPFLQNVTRGRAVAPSRLEEVAARYLELGGKSPINAQTQALVDALRDALGSRLPVYWGNRNWRPFLADTVRSMAQDGVRRAAAFVTSAYSSYSSCRQYLEDIEAARKGVGRRAPEVVKLRPYFNHPGFVEPFSEGLRSARAEAGEGAPVLMSAHSIPVAMAAACEYERQLAEASRLVAEQAGEAPGSWSLVFQSRSGGPGERWLEPDLASAISSLAAGLESVIVVPIGFVSDHMEVVYDIDRQAAALARARGMRLVRSATPGTHPRFVRMVVELLEEADGTSPPAALGPMGARSCPSGPDCCRRE